MGIVYLIQPCELIGTNRFKIGCSSSSTIDRIKNYKKGTLCLQICECDKPFKLEKIIKEEFNNKFKRIAGNEYFEGDKEEMKTLFINITTNKNIILEDKQKETKTKKNKNKNVIDRKYEDLYKMYKDIGEETRFKSLENDLKISEFDKNKAYEYLLNIYNKLITMPRSIMSSLK